VEIAVNTADGHAILPHNVVIGAKQEVHILSNPAEPGAVETAQRATANHGKFHGLMDKWIDGFMETARPLIHYSTNPTPQ
jgi:hypothetical protein